jgi:hypothetical protein
VWGHLGGVNGSAVFWMIFGQDSCGKVIVGTSNAVVVAVLEVGAAAIGAVVAAVGSLAKTSVAFVVVFWRWV